MLKREDKTPPEDPNEAAKSVLDQLIEHSEQEPPESEKNPAAVALGRLKGGKARAKKLSAKRRSEIAKNAAKARWEKESAEQ